jgi:DNA polymerase III subunit epsilon
MLLIGIDTETTGLSPVDDRITEIGAVAWDTDHATPVAFFHRFIKQEKPLPDFIKELTGLNDEILEKYGVMETVALGELKSFIGNVSPSPFDNNNPPYLVAQNAPFDKGMLDAAYLRNGSFIPEVLWIDTVKDIPYPARIKSKSLVSVAAEHGFLNPFPHRAVTDVLTMLTVMSKYDIQKIIENACEPKVLVWAKTTYAEKDKAKAAGFYYNGERKMWFKSIMLKDLMEETEKCRIQGFEVQVIYEKSEDKKST